MHEKNLLLGLLLLGSIPAWAQSADPLAQFNCPEPLQPDRTNRKADAEPIALNATSFNYDPEPTSITVSPNVINVNIHFTLRRNGTHGVYFHRVSESEYRIIKEDPNHTYTTVPFDTYGVNKATEINMFLMDNYTHVPCCDVGGVASTIGYDPNTPGSYWVKLFNSHELYRWRKENEGKTIALSGGAYIVTQSSLPMTANSLGHEMGHITGLAHTFHGANGCADANSPTQGQSGNNQMDYTNASGTALTPCQLDIVKTNLYNPGNPANSYRNYLSYSFYNEVPPRAFFVMPTCQYTGNVQMDSRGTFLADQMTVRVYAYESSAPEGQGALLVSYTRPVSQGGRWNLATLYAFAPGQTYVVTLTAQRNSGQFHTRAQTFQVNAPGTVPCN